MGYPNLKQSVWLLILFFLITAALWVPIAVLGYILDQPLHLSPYLIWLVTLASFVLIVIYAQRRTERTLTEILLLKPVPWRTYLPLGVSIIGLAVVNMELANQLWRLMPMPEILTDALRDLADKEKPYLFGFYIMVVQAPLTEEVCFRGVILGGLLAHRTRIKAIVWSSVLFALFHANPWQFPAALILGLVFAWWVIRTGSLIPAIAGHALNNFLALTVARLELFGSMDDFNTVVFFPWWLNVCGIVLAVIGLTWFYRMANGHEPQVETPVDDESDGTAL